MEVETSDEVWTQQIGAVLGEEDAAGLLGLSPAALRHAGGLLRLRNRDGRPVYPIFQFADRAQLTGVAEVVTTLAPALLPLAIASWLTGPNRALGGRRRVDLLREGEQGRVLQLARQLAAAGRY
jgi:hypothetical protein